MNTLAFAFAPGPMEIGIIAMIALLLFGNRLPKIARSLGSSLVEFKKGVKGIEEDLSLKNETKEFKDVIDTTVEAVKS